LHLGIGFDEADVGERIECLRCGERGGAGARADVEQRSRFEVTRLAESRAKA
jgi:hypothetical protein